MSPFVNSNGKQKEWKDRQNNNEIFRIVDNLNIRNKKSTNKIFTRNLNKQAIAV